MTSENEIKNPGWCRYVPLKGQPTNSGRVCLKWKRINEINPLDEFSTNHYNHSSFYIEVCLSCPFCKDTSFIEHGLYDWEMLTQLVLEKDHRKFPNLCSDLGRIHEMIKNVEPSGLTNLEVICMGIHYSALIQHYNKLVKAELERIKNYVGYKDEIQEEHNPNVGGDLREMQTPEQDSSTE